MKPGLGWRVARRFTQLFAIIAVLLAPFLGGWQRLERNDLSSWHSPDTEIPGFLRERLPRGDDAGDAYTYNAIMGGGVGVEYLEVPVIDPLAGALTLMAGVPTLRAIVALALPVLLAMVAGRFFCGWFCPFGTLSRALAWLTDFVPWRTRPAIPASRPVRYVVLAAGLLAGLFGAHVVLYLALPHLLVQQTLYASWLLGGGGAALGLLIGLMIAGVMLGPTTYCAAVCPTGAALSLLGRKRVVRLSIVEPKSCGKTCQRCSTSCWIQLDPASGDPGPDCDLCARCVPQCPKANLSVTVRKPQKRERLARAAVVGLALFATASTADAQSPVRRNPEMILAAETIVDGVTIAVDVTDQTGVRLSADGDEPLRGSVISVFLARGERGEPDERGLLPEREIYDGPLTVHYTHYGNRETLHFDGPNSPRSTPRRAIFREHLPWRLLTGDEVVIEPVEGWLDEELRLEVPSPGVDASPWTVAFFGVVGVALFGGLLFIALGIRREPATA